MKKEMVQFHSASSPTFGSQRQDIHDATSETFFSLKLHLTFFFVNFSLSLSCSVLGVPIAPSLKMCLAFPALHWEK